MGGDGPVMTVQTGREDRPVTGFDTLMVAMPPEFYVEVEGDKALAAIQFTRWIRYLAERSASNIGEVLHHAEFVITNNPATVQDLGTRHDCDVCRSSVRLALQRLSEDPELELVVGTLYWAGPKAS